MRIGLAWDLGAGRGHAVRIAALAARLHDAGHSPCVFARDLRTQRACLRADLRCLPAPHNDWIPDIGRAPANWGDILWSEVGLHDPAQAQAIALAWRDLFASLEVEVVLADGAPLALLAARSLGLRTSAIGTGFLVPPPGPPWPLFRDWEAVDLSAVAALEQRIGAHLDQIGAALGVADVRGALAGDRQLLFTQSALDHYPGRSGGHYVGPLAGDGVAPHWPAAPRRVFVYLQPHYAHLEPLRRALAERADLGVLAYFGGAACWETASRCRVAEQPVAIRHMLEQADLVIGHGGNLAVLAAEAGVPGLWLPTQAETYLTARRTRDLGIARSVTPPFDALDFATPLAQLLDDPALRQRAREFAASLRRRDDAEILDEVIAVALRS